MIAALVLGAVALLAALGTWVVRHYALRNALLDIPNERSSHTKPTPRGGGVAIVAALLAGLVAGRVLGWIEPRLWSALCGGGVLVAVIGFIDDHRHVAARVRVLVHVAAAGWALWMLGGMPQLRLGTATLQLGALGWVIGALGIVWAINFYNFMDGIDGIAASEAIVVGGAGALLAMATASAAIALAAALIAAAAAGFLVWNWPPARIFMGDIGSGFLGYAVAVTAIASEAGGGPPLLAWMVLLGVFVIDATVTLARRLARRERWFAAHRSHAYQRAVQAGHSHARVSTAVVLLGLVLACLAFVITRWERYAAVAGVLATAVLVSAYLAVERMEPMRRTGARQLARER